MSASKDQETPFEGLLTAIKNGRSLDASLPEFERILTNSTLRLLREYNAGKTKDLPKWIGGDLLRFLPFADDLEMIEQFGGEGQGEEYWVVFRFMDKFYQFDAYYSSWEGIDYDDSELYEVEPVVVPKTIYKRKP